MKDVNSEGKRTMLYFKKNKKDRISSRLTQAQYFCSCIKTSGSGDNYMIHNFPRHYDMEKKN